MTSSNPGASAPEYLSFAMTQETTPESPLTTFTMVLHPDTLTAILNNWDAPKYDGSQDVYPWLMAIEELCRIYGIPPVQMTEMAVRCTTGHANPVLTAMFEVKAAKAGTWLWGDFKQCVIQIEGE